MFKYIIKRLVFMVLVFIGITFAVYCLSNMAPGNVVDNMISSMQEVTQDQIDALYEEYGLNDPIVVRYFRWLGDLLTGDMGKSYKTGLAVSDMIGQRIIPTITLTGSGLLIAIIIGIPLGILASLKPGGIWDKISSVITFFGSSFPSFFVALVAIYFLSVEMALLPASGMYYSGEEKTFGALLEHLILPATVLSLNIMGRFIKQTRGSMLEVLNEEYIKTARSKGIKEVAVVIKHAFRNALIPVITAIGLTVPFLIGGAVVIEQIFAWPGLGSLMNSSIIARDYPAVMGVTVVISIVVLVCNLLLDIIYAFLDPRISYK